MSETVVARDIAMVRDLSRRLAASISGVISGKPEVVDAAICTLLAGGHLLIEDVPGVGKTTLATALARSIDARVTRIQFTSDMLPTDVTGVSVFDAATRQFRFHPGPVFANVVIGDEVNRATPKTQSALLEAMGEKQVTVDGETLPLPAPFMVAATQNPQDMEGTFPLPEAQRDRFMARISVGYPDAVAEVAMLDDRRHEDPLALVAPVCAPEGILAAQQAVADVDLDDKVAAYLVALVASTRTHPDLLMGASPRATLHLARMARSRAAMQGRTFVSPDDVARLAGIVLPHRLLPRGHHATATEALDSATRIVAGIVSSLRVPGLR